MLNKSKAEELRDNGMKSSLYNADLFYDQEWTKVAYSCLMQFVRITRDPFLAEEVRDWAEKFGNVPPPPSLRAWGGIISKANRNGIIEHVGYRKTSSIKSHRTPASLWKGVSSEKKQ